MSIRGITGIDAAFYRGKRVLVTGHTGFKGSWLTEWLLMMGAKVTGLALPPSTNPSLFDQLGLAGRCDHRIGDIRDRALVRKLVHEIRPDLVFHLAAQPLVRLSYEQPVETFDTNIMGTAHVLDALRDADWPCAAVMITTDKVYENLERQHAYRESDPLGGYDPYSSSKACAELVIQSYRLAYFNPAKIRIQNSEFRIQNSDSCILNPEFTPLVAVASARAGNVIGGGDWALDRIVPDSMKALARGEAIRVRNPQSTRPWQHVMEPLSGYLLLGQRLHESLMGKVGALPLATYATSFNFGPDAGSNRPVRDLVEEVLKHWPGRWEDGSESNAPHEAGLLHLSTEKAAQVLGWRPRWGFEQTLAETVLWYKSVHQQGAAKAQTLVGGQIREYSAGNASVDK